jgi:hypothetical protein
MNPLLKMMMARLMAPAGDDGADTGGTDTSVVDRGDVVDPALTPENLEAVAGAEGGEEAGSTGQDPEGEGANGEAGEGEHGRQAPAGIPKGRFNEVNQQRKDALAALAAANEEIARLKAAQAPAAATPTPAPAATPAAPAPAAKAPSASPDQGGVFDVEAQEEAYVAALMEGNTKEAVAIRRAINAHLQEEASARATQELTARQSAQLLAQAAGNVSQAYPWLDKAEHADVLDLIIAARDRKIAQGMPAHLALVDAANTIAPKFAPADDGGTPSRVSETGAPAKDLRPAAAIARGAADSTAQPPALQVGIGERATATRVNVAQLTEEQFEALTPAEKKRLRGD